jgi:hypothetical protein
MEEQITVEEYFEIFSKNKPNLCVHSSFTDMDGTHPLGNGDRQIVTVWGLRDSDSPLIKAVSEGSGESVNHKYFRC